MNTAIELFQKYFNYSRGDRQWWVGEEQEVVEKALALLVREGAIEQRGDTCRAAQQKLSGDERNKIHQALEQLVRN